MARSSSVPRPGKAQEFFLNLYEDVAVDLHIYCEVLSAQKTKVINKAVRALIETNLEQNVGFRERFVQMRDRFLDEERHKRQTPQAGRFRVVDGRRPRGAKGLRGRAKNRPNGGDR